MSTNHQAPPTMTAPTATQCFEATHGAFGSALLAGLVGGALYAIGKMIEAEVSAAAARMREAPADGATSTHATSDDVGDAEDTDDKAVQAAALLGVPIDATEDQIRAALRARLASSRLHPDHGGDGEAAKRLIAAKNLLIEHARAMQ